MIRPQPSDSDRPLSQLTVNSDLDAIETVLGWFEQLSDPAVPPELWMQAQLALVEGFTNAVRHAHAGLDPPPPVRLSVQVTSEQFCVQILDRGAPFDFEAALAAVDQAMEASGHDPLAREAHWGLVMLLKLRSAYGWTIRYRRIDDGTNGLSLCHPISADGAAGTSS
ncbi:anti-sigma regulatory factor [Cyanobium sp. Copco_Reservoir_LC18]|jgi:serine/threonine-protein kinase RsbW|uniref:ATP-binding protein n=1 Tax=Cyanobium sp. Copco_Reservoir_LC18 TaxID=1328305 RepID=UPI00135CC427|nr:ATP-binding protein [Cyanobium sp. Copco_Reservoir_LC18]KAF0654054.1 anti-sigma regulatory factor [Cyanobium sp. Copco_Reservoir_LC18]